MSRTIKVTGRARLSVRPDTTRIMITLSAVLKDYEKAVQDAADKKNELAASLAELGFKKSDLKTTRYDISPEHESYQDDKGHWQNRFKGYRYEHTLKLEFPVDNDTLGKVFYKLAHSSGAPEFRLLYTVKDPEPLKNKLLAQAVKDSREKAAVLADAAGVSLGEIQMIDYSWGEVEVISRSYDMVQCNKMAKFEEEKIDMDIEADDIDIQDTVTVVWEIK
ncbi:MAG: SIMPL domain-containing protein [Lachnospiraceae bacterium]|nr:SIMPL domain-containing protein [Lachnospiraceae bacterium]